METLPEYNRNRWAEYTAATGQSVQNGIACPHCGVEMWDSAPNMTLLTHPPMKRVHCDACGFRGNRVI